MKEETKKSLQAWQTNAKFWDEAMGDRSNEFHREVVRPYVTQLLEPKKGDFILDVACGNGNYAAYLACKGVRVVAFDYASELLTLAKKRQHAYLDQIEFVQADATDLDSLLTLKRDRPYHKAVSNMAIMDISEIEPLFQALYQLLDDEGIFVFATQHPCFVTLTDRYMTAHQYQGEAIAGQPVLQTYYHRSLQDIFQTIFKYGFVVDGFRESCFRDPEHPEIIVVRASKRGEGNGTHHY